MNRLTLALAVLTVGILNVILALGPGTRGPAFEIAIEVLPFVMIPSSLLLAVRFAKAGHPWFAGMFLLNVALFLIVVGLLVLGVPPREQILFVADVLQLNLYLVALGMHRPLIGGRLQSTSGVAR